MSNVAENLTTDQIAYRADVAQLFWRAFPSDSANQLAETAAVYVGRQPRQIIKYLKEEADAPGYVRDALRRIVRARTQAELDARTPPPLSRLVVRHRHSH